MTSLKKELKPRVKEVTLNYLKTISSLPSLELELLLSKITNLSREQLLAYPKQDFGQKTCKKFKKLEKKRLTNWPLAYLTGQKNFFKSNFIVSPAVLIPRPETEILVEKTLEKINSNDLETTIIDVGTGSGVIIISLAKELIEKEKINFFAIDISKKALQIAKKNIRNHNLENTINLKKGNLLKPVITDIKKCLKDNKQIIITANLPYLKPEEMKEISIQREPKIALLSGKNGLKHYQSLFKQLKTLNIKTNFFLICEINPEQVDDFKELFNTTLTNMKLEFIKDLNHHFRFALITAK